MFPPLHTDLLKHLPDTHRPANVYEREAMRRHRALRQAIVLALVNRIRAAAARLGKRIRRISLTRTGTSKIGSPF